MTELGFGAWWIDQNVKPRGDEMTSSRPSTPSTPPPRPSSTRPVGSPLRPQSPPLQTGVPSSNPRARASSHQSAPPSRSDSFHRTPSGPVNASTTSLPNPSQPDKTRSKARDLLRKHYGLGVGPPPPTGKPQDPMDLGKSADCGSAITLCITPSFVDSPAFDAKAYYEQLITTSSLTTLLKRESELLSGMLCRSRSDHSLSPFLDVDLLTFRRDSIIG